MSWLDVELPDGADEVSAQGKKRLLIQARREILLRTYVGTFAYPLLTLFMGLVGEEAQAHPVRLLCWLGGLSTVVVIRVVLYRLAIGQTESMRWPGRAHLLLGIGSSAALSVYACILFHGGGGTAASVAGLIAVAGLASMLVTIASIRRATAYLWTSSCLLPIVVTTFAQGGKVGFALGIMFLYYGAIITSAVAKAHRAYWRANLSSALLDDRAREGAALSRKAGMAEIAANILHDVGNALNSVKTTVAELGALRDRDPAPDLQRAKAMLDQHRHGLTRFLAHESQGQKVLAFIHALAADATTRSEQVAGELSRLGTLTSHIEVVVRRQQEIAGMSVARERCGLVELVSFALEVAGHSRGLLATRFSIAVPERLCVSADRHRTVQVLVNLFKNAIEATRAVECPRIEVVGRSLSADHVELVVRDNGEGACEGTLRSAFRRGFTTKAHGHGFGLHNAGLIAKAMGGSLTFESEGVGHGATATLCLPAINASLAA